MIPNQSSHRGYSASTGRPAVSFGANTGQAASSGGNTTPALGLMEARAAARDATATSNWDKVVAELERKAPTDDRTWGGAAQGGSGGGNWDAAPGGSGGGNWDAWVGSSKRPKQDDRW
jgi:hypothetical protein